MVTMTDDGLIFLHDCRPSSHLAVLGYTGNCYTRIQTREEKYIHVHIIMHVL